MKLFRTKHDKNEERDCSRRRTCVSGWKSVLPLCFVLFFAACLTIGGTLAFMQETTGPVTNTFKAGNITYTLNLEANANSVNHQDSEVTMPSALSAQTVTDLSVAFTADRTPSLTGYTFDGWYYADGNLHTAYPGTSITVDYTANDENPDANKVEITLYAQWTPNTYQVAYNGNGATSGSMENSEHTYDVAKNLTTNAYVKNGYTFSGWNTQADGKGTAYADKASVVNLTEENGATVILYAQWQANGYKVNYDGNGATAGSMSPSEHTYDVEKALTANAYEKTGYIFTGWNTKADGTGKAYANEETVLNLVSANGGEITLYAEWMPITYTVEYNKNGDDKAGITGSTASSTHTYDEAKNLTTNGYERTGYTFIGWNTEPNGSGKSYADAESVMNLTTVHNDTVTLYAQWGAKSYVIRYHANGGEGTMHDQTIKYDVPTILSKNEFTKDDYTFLGWAISESGEEKYIDEQIVVNLKESGIVDLYAVWVQNAHTVTFDYNGGSGSPESKKVLAGKAYGTLPEYPVHPTTTIGENEIMSYLFTGWYTEPSGGTRVYPSDIVTRTDDHTLYAHWKEAPTNNVIKDLVVKNNPDDNGDGVVDSFYVNLKCSSSFEKLNIPLENLVVGQKYKLSFTESNNATYGMNEEGYGGAIYGFIITPNKTLTGGSIKAESISDGGLIKQFSDRYDGKLNGPRYWETTFTAEASTMYWTWDYGLILDGYNRDYNYTNIQLVPVEPEIKFAEKNLIIHSSSTAQVLNDTSSAYGTNFVFDGAGYAETMYYPITGLTAGTTYTITFDHKFTGSLIDDAKDYTDPRYQYGCGIMNTAPTVFGSYMSSISSSWASNTFVMTSVTGNTESVTLTFTATSDTAYWVWNMANCSDSNNCTIDIKVTKFSASHKNGGSITYYDAASQATTLGLMIDPTDVPDIVFNWEGINNTHIDIWYPADEQNPVAGDSYELVFEPTDGYVMSEIIIVTIDDVSYEVYTDGNSVESTEAPYYNHDTNILTIPAELLTLQTASVSVTASAVPIEISTTTEQEETTDLAEAGGETENEISPVEIVAVPTETESSEEETQEAAEEGSANESEPTTVSSGTDSSGEETTNPSEEVAE